MVSGAILGLPGSSLNKFVGWWANKLLCHFQLEIKLILAVTIILHCPIDRSITGPLQIDHSINGTGDDEGPSRMFKNLNHTFVYDNVSM